MTKITTDRALKLLRVIEKSEEISQRELAEDIDVSLGTVNQTIRALVSAGVLETVKVTTSRGKRGQTYHLTDLGRQEQKALSKLRIQECENEVKQLKSEITALKTAI